MQRIAATKAPVVIDLGAGEGTYSDLARGWRPDALWVAVEVWQPYLDQFNLWRKYDVVAIRDAREFPLPKMPYVLIAGDVLEHMTRQESTALLERAMQDAEAIVASVPVVDYHQHHHDNPFEEHLDQWTHAQMIEQLPGCQYWRGNLLGRYFWTRPEPLDDEPEPD